MKKKGRFTSGQLLRKKSRILVRNLDNLVWGEGKGGLRKEKKGGKKTISEEFWESDRKQPAQEKGLQANHDSRFGRE